MFELVERIRRTGRAVPPQCRRGRPAGAAGDHERPADRPGDPHHPRLRLFLAPRQHRRGPAPHPPHPCLRHGQGAAAAGHAWPTRSSAPGAPGISREQLQAFFARALCSPVLTAHPTEIRRKSSIDREMEIARLLDERDRVEFTPEELAANRRALRRAVLTLWQTSMLRGTRLRVIDEVANGLAYYDHTFLRALPRLLRRPRGSARRRSTRPGRASTCRPSCAWAAGSAATATAIPSSPPT